MNDQRFVLILAHIGLWSIVGVALSVSILVSAWAASIAVNPWLPLCLIACVVGLGMMIYGVMK